MFKKVEMSMGLDVQARQSDEEEDSGEDQAEEEEEEQEEAEQGRKKYQLRERRPIQQANLYQPSFGGQGTRQASALHSDQPMPFSLTSSCLSA